MGSGIYRNHSSVAVEPKDMFKVPQFAHGGRMKTPPDSDLLHCGPRAGHAVIGRMCACGAVTPPLSRTTRARDTPSLTIRGQRCPWEAAGKWYRDIKVAIDARIMAFQAGAEAEEEIIPRSGC